MLNQTGKLSKILEEGCHPDFSYNDFFTQSGPTLHLKANRRPAIRGAEVSNIEVSLMYME